MTTVSEMKAKGNTEELVQVLKNHDAPETRAEAAKALGEMGIREPVAIEVLVWAMLNDPYSVKDSYRTEYPVRAAAAEALTQMPDAIELEKWYEALNDKDEGVRRNAIEALGKLSNRESLPHLIKMVKDEDFLVQRQAIESLGEIAKGEDEEAIETIKSCLTDEYVYACAIQALGQIWKMPDLKQLGQDYDQELPNRVSVAKSLGQQRDERALRPLVATLRYTDKDKERPLREAVAEAVGKFGEPAVNLLQSMIEQFSGGARLAATRALALTHTPAAIDFLVARLKQAGIDPEEKRTILAGLRGSESPKAAEAIIDMLSDANEDVRDQATRLFPIAGMTRRDQKEAIIGLVIADEPSPGFDAEVLAKALRSTGANPDYTAQRLVKEAASLLVREAEDAVLEVKDTAKIERLLGFTENFAGRAGTAGAILILADSKALDQEKANKLWMELGGSMAMKMLGARFDESFRKPVKEVWNDGKKNWETTIRRADLGFKIMLGMDVLVFILGMVIAGFSVYFLATSRGNDLALLFGSGVTFLGGMAILLSMFYKGPVEKINNSITALGRTHTAFLGLMNRLAQISCTFEYLYVKDKIDLAQVEKMNELLEDAMRDTNELLSALVVVSADKETRELLERVLPKLDKGEGEDKGKGETQ